MNVCDMRGRVLDWCMSAAITVTERKPAEWQPTKKWDQVTPFWVKRNASVARVNSAKAPRAGCIGEGTFEATCENYTARGADPLEAICRVMVYEAFGATVDVPVEFLR